MIDLQKLIATKKINKVQLSKILDISRATLDIWIKENQPENVAKIIGGINRMAQNLMIKEEPTIDNAITQRYEANDYSFQQKTEGEMQGNFIGEPKEIHYNGIDNITLNKIIKSYEDFIAMLHQQLSEKDERIKELERILSTKQKEHM